MLRYEKVRINRSEVLIFNVAVPAWEVPVLVAVNGEDRCFPEGTELARKEAPDPQAEYDRLDSKYGSNNESGQSYVGMVYGVGQIGVKRLADEIAKAASGEIKETAPAGDAEVYDPTAELFEEAPRVAEGAHAINE
jgi:hypothetical protein